MLSLLLFSFDTSLKVFSNADTEKPFLNLFTTEKATE